MFLQTLPKQRIIWMHEREERWFNAMWENCHSPDFQLQWKQDLRMNGFNFEKLVNEVRHVFRKTRHEHAKINSSREAGSNNNMASFNIKFILLCCKNVRFRKINGS